MMVRVITLKFDPVLDAIDDRPLQAYVKDRDVMTVSEYFFVREDTPYLAVVVVCRAKRPEAEEPVAKGRSEEERAGWRALLAPDDMPLFNNLRDWRKSRAQEEGVPVYVIGTNRQLAQIAHERPEALSGLARVEGYGKAKIERYGRAILEIVAPATTGEHAEREAAVAGDAEPEQEDDDTDRA